ILVLIPKQERALSEIVPQVGIGLPCDGSHRAGNGSVFDWTPKDDHLTWFALGGRREFRRLQVDFPISGQRGVFFRLHFCTSSADFAADIKWPSIRPPRFLVARIKRNSTRRRAQAGRQKQLSVWLRQYKAANPELFTGPQFEAVVEIGCCREIPSAP